MPSWASWGANFRPGFCKSLNTDKGLSLHAELLPVNDFLETVKPT